MTSTIQINASGVESIHNGSSDRSEEENAAVES